ncbi:PaaI family thioesterase [Brevibacillus marinus]|uniref:PaaI family thioesterase n=1 Tax=Brevibacillus marinus TaxID=2496837 RepID=UPI0013DF7804|nr:PaaI family thioesterase [Brevibacillus marinus]
MKDLLAEVERKFAESPFWQWLGLEAHHIIPGEVQLKLAIRPEFLNVVRSVHGGVYASVLDTTMGFTVRSQAGCPAVTVNMNISFLKATDQGNLWSKGRIINMGRNLAVAEAYIYNDEGQPLAHATGTFKIIHSK